MTTKKIIHKCQKIKVIISDVDGVLTDGGVYYSEKGEILKKFNTRDGMAIKLMRYGIKTIIVSQEKSKIIQARAKKIKASDVFTGILKKELLLPKICKKYQVSKSEIAYIGDDMNDYEIMKKVGFSATPADGMKKIKLISDYICKTKGGAGAFRELSDLILDNRKKFR